MTELGMGALLGVAQGSRTAGRALLAMRLEGGRRARQPLAFVGKGVTFDSGGICIKPAAGMEDMKWDMGGAGAVAGTMLALATRKAKANVVGVCGLVENMPDGNAQRPGDVVTSHVGPDDRGDQHRRRRPAGAVRRADLGAARPTSPRAIVDLATLTGAIMISLGKEYARPVLEQ